MHCTPEPRCSIKLASGDYEEAIGTLRREKSMSDKTAVTHSQSELAPFEQ